MVDQILQNSSDSIDIEIIEDGALTDADGDVTVTISNPNGTVIYAGVTATKTSTGKYQYTLSALNTAVLGTYSAVWSFTLSSSVMQHTQPFEVVSAISSGYLLADEYREKTSLDVSSKSNSQLDNYIERATYLIEAYVGGSIRMTTYEEKQNCVIDYNNQGVHIQMNHAPIDSVTSLVLMFNPTYEATLVVSNVRINQVAGFLEYFGLNLTSALIAGVQDVSTTTIKPVATVVYSAGYVEIPKRVELATIRLVDQLINAEIAQVAPIKSVSIGEYSETYDTKNNPFNLGKIGTDEVIELLKDYKHPIARNRFIV